MAKRRKYLGGLIGNSLIQTSEDKDPYWYNVELLMDGTSLTTDLSPRNQRITEQNTSTALSYETDPFGNTQNVLDFSRTDATGSGLKIGDAPIEFGNNPVSIEMFIKLDTTGVVHTLYCDREASGTSFVNFRVNSSSEIQFFHDHLGGGLFSGSTAMTTGTWYHVALTYDGSTVRLFLDGTLDASSSITLTFTSTQSPHLGLDPEFPAETYQLDGQMALVRVTKGVARHINTNGTYTYPVPTESFVGADAVDPVNFGVFPIGERDEWGGLVGQGIGASYGDPHWSSVKLFLDGTDPLNDISDLNQDAELTNHNGVTTGTVPGPSGYGNVNVMQFDGTDDFISSSNPSFNFNQDFTLEGWFYIDSHTGNRGFFSHWDGDNAALSGILVSMIDNVNGPGEFIMFAGDGYTWAINSGVPGLHFYTPNSWHHIACTRSGDTFRMFANGVIVAEETSAGLQVAKSGEFAICSSQSGSGGTQHFQGDVFDVRITMGVARYTEAFTPPTSHFITELQENSVKNTGVVSLAENYQTKIDAPVYTFEMWGAGGGGGGAHSGATLSTEHSGPGGNGAYISGTLTGITSGTVLEFLSGAVGVGGINASGAVATSGGGGGASAIRIKDGDVVAVAGGGGGGGQSGASGSVDSTGGRGGNSVDGSGVYATDVAQSSGGDGGQSGTSSSAGSHPSRSLANPPTKTEDLQDGGDGMKGNNGSAGGATNNTNPVGWGGSGGEGALDVANEGAGGGGGGGYFGGSGGSGASSGNDSGAGGGGGGSYINGTYVSSYTSSEGNYEAGTAHDGSAQPSSMVNGRGGKGNLYTVDPYTRDGVPGGVNLYKNGVLVKSINHSGDTTTYTIE